MRLIKQVTLHLQKGSKVKIAELDLCESGGGKYIVNSRTGNQGDRLKESTGTVLPVSLERAEKVYEKLEQKYLKKGYVQVKAFEEQITTLSSPPNPSTSDAGSGASETNQEDSTPSNQTSVQSGQTSGGTDYRSWRSDASSGSRPGNSPQSSTPPSTGSNTIEGLDAKETAILNRLRSPRRLTRSNKKHPWPLSRVLYRIGTLRLKNLVPYLRDVEPVTPIEKYSYVYALARCAHEAGLPILESIAQVNSPYPVYIKRFAIEGLLALYKGEAKRQYLDRLLHRLPESYIQAIMAGDEQSLRDFIAQQARDEPQHLSKQLPKLYQLTAGWPQLRPLILELIKTQHFRPPWFKAFRAIYKLAELRDDPPVYGLLVKRFISEKALYTKPSYTGYGRYINGQYIKDLEKEVQKSDSRIAWSNRTRLYFIRRSFRYLKQLGEDQNDAYVKMAVGVLLNYKDGESNNSERLWDYNNYDRRVFIDKWGRMPHFSLVLYGNGPRYKLSPGKLAYVTQGGYEPGNPGPQVREEAFSHLWDKSPQGLIMLLAESKNKDVHQFALKALQANPQGMAMLDRFAAIAFLKQKEYEATLRLGLDTAIRLYDPAQPDVGLVLAMMGCGLKEGYDQAISYIEQNLAFFLEQGDFVFSMLTNPDDATRKWAIEKFQAYRFSQNFSDVLIGRSIAWMLELKDRNPDKKLATEVGSFLVDRFSDSLREMGMPVIMDLFRSPVPEVRAFAGKVLMDHTIAVKDLPEEILAFLMQAEEAVERRVGIALYGKLPEVRLIDEKIRLLAYVLSPKEDVREAARPILTRLATNRLEISGWLGDELISILRRKEKVEGLHQELLSWLLNDLRFILKNVQAETIWGLVFARPVAARQLGIELLKSHLRPEMITVPQLIRLAGQEVLSGRELAWDLFTRFPDRIKAEKTEAIRMLYCDWEDSRQFGFGWFRDHFQQEDWNPELLIGICDSVREDVQEFGREMVLKFFREEDGEEYLLKLSQHPVTSMQAFAVNYLEQFASGNPDRIRDLEGFFITLLSAVNRGRTAKDRVLAFLTREALLNLEIARIVIPILDRVVLTIAYTDKASCLTALRDIRLKHTALEVPIEIQSPSQRT